VTDNLNDHMTTLKLDERRADFEIECTNKGEYRERTDHSRLKMPQFLVGCVQVMLNIEQ